jgi:type II restriction/modification system DNA methylase subunit YeeA
MKLAWADIKKNLIGFVHDWEKEPGNERQQAQDFCRQLFNCYGIDNRRYFSFRFEEEVKLDDGSIGYIDCFWPGKILIEMKSAGKDLAVAEKQAKKYFEGLEEKDLPKLMVVSDFKRFKVVDMDTGKPYEFFLQDLPKQAEILGPLVEKDVYATVTQDPVNVRAAEQMGAVHDFLKKDNYTGHKLELYLARLVFCFFAEDAMLFDADQFYSYVRNSTVENLGSRFAELFSTLNTPMDKRSKYTPEELAAFPYVNGGLFAERIDVPHFSAGIFKTLEACAALDWSKISPAIFGSMFQGSMDAKERRNLGAHFTSEENILKVIKPLFLDELYEKYAVARGNKARLKKLQEEIARLQFLDIKTPRLIQFNYSSADFAA